MGKSSASGRPVTGLGELTLLVQQPQSPDQEFFVQRGLTIGRSPSNTICVDDPSVERIHARVMHQPDGTMLLQAETDHARLVSASGEASATRHKFRYIR